MSNPNFVPLFSTNEIYRNTDNTICLTDVSNDGATIQNSIKHLFVYDNKLVGDSVNNTGTINRDVTIRAVYEF